MEAVTSCARERRQWADNDVLTNVIRTDGRRTEDAIKGKSPLWALESLETPIEQVGGCSPRLQYDNLE